MPAAAPAGAFRRLAALVYDSLLVVAILFLGTLLVLPLSGGEAITPASQGPSAYLYRAWVALLAIGYFGLSWTRRGQTLGMMAWKIRLVLDDGRLPGWRDCLRRLLLGSLLLLAAIAGLWWLRAPVGSLRWLLGLGLLLPALANYLWIAFDAAGRSLQDWLGGCRVERLDGA